MTITLNGTDISSYVKEKGLSWSLNSIDANGAGRNLNGEMQRKLVALKNKLEVQCRPLLNTEKDALATLLSNQWLTVVVTTSSGTSTYTMYPSATVKGSVLMVKGGIEYWDGVSFSLIEK